MKTKPILRHHYTLIRMTKQKTRTIPNIGNDTPGDLTLHWWRCRAIAPLWKKNLLSS